MIWLKEQHDAVQLGVGDSLSWLGAKVCQSKYVGYSEPFSPKSPKKSVSNEDSSKGNEAFDGGNADKALDDGNVSKKKRPPEDDKGNRFDLVEDAEATESPVQSERVVCCYNDQNVAKQDLKLSGGDGEPVILEGCRCLPGGKGTDGLRLGMRLILANDEGPDFFDQKPLRRVLNLNPPIELVFESFADTKPAQTCTAMRLIVTVGKRRLLLVPTWAQTCVGDSSFTRKLEIDDHAANVPMEVTMAKIAETSKRLIPPTMLAIHHQGDQKAVKYNCRFEARIPLIALRHFPESDIAAMNAGMSELRAQEVSFGVRVIGQMKALFEGDQHLHDQTEHSSNNGNNPPLSEMSTSAGSLSEQTMSPKSSGSNRSSFSQSLPNKMKRQSGLMFAADAFTSSPGISSSSSPKENLESSSAPISRVSRSLGGPKKDARRFKTVNEAAPPISPKLTGNTSQRGSLNSGGASTNKKRNVNGMTPAPKISGYEWQGYVESTSRRLRVCGDSVESLLDNMETVLCKEPPQSWDALGVHPNTSPNLNLGMPSCPKCEGPLYPVSVDRLSRLREYSEFEYCTSNYCNKPTFGMLYCVACDDVVCRCDTCYSYPSKDQVIAITVPLGREQDDKFGSDAGRRQVLRRRAGTLAQVLCVSPCVLTLTAKKAEDTMSFWDVDLVCMLAPLGPLRRPRGGPGKISGERPLKPLALFLELVTRWKHDKSWPPESLSWLGSTPPKISEVVLSGAYDVGWISDTVHEEASHEKWNQSHDVALRLFNLVAPEGQMAPSDFAVFQCNVLAKLAGDHSVGMEYADVVLQAFFGSADADGDGSIDAEEYFDAQEEICEVLNFSKDKLIEVLAEIEQDKIQAEKDFQKAKKEAKLMGQVMGNGRIQAKDFHKAIEKGDIADVKCMLLRGANVMGEFNGESPLHCAARVGSVEICECLLNFRAKVDNVDYYHGNTPFDVACTALIADNPGASIVCTMMLKHRAKLRNLVETALFQAVRKSSQPHHCIPLLINGGVDVSALDSKGRTALDVAWELETPLLGLQALVEKGTMLREYAASAVFESLEHEHKCADDSIVKAILEARAQVTQEGAAGTALTMAVKTSNCAEEFISHVAKRSAEEFVLDNIDEEDCSALDYAVKSERWTVCWILVNLGAKLNKVKDEGFFTALARGDTGLAKMMLTASANVNAANELGQRPLTVCAEMNNVELMEIMLTGPVDLHQMDSFQNTPIHIACGKNNPDMVKMMLQAAQRQNFDLNCVNYKGHTPLDVLLQQMVSNPSSWNSQLCKMVTEAGCKPLKMGRDAFFKAVELKDMIVLKSLLQGRIDVNQYTIDGEGAYPVHVAALAEKSDMLRLFLQYSADVNLKKLFGGDTALHLAIRAGRSDLAAELIQMDRCDMSINNLKKFTALDEAIWARDQKVTQKLLNKSARLGEVGKKEILFNTLSESQVDAVPVWIDFALTGGADVTAEESPVSPLSPKKPWSDLEETEHSDGSPSHRQPLTLAAYLGLERPVLSLLKCKANPNWQNCEGRTALHYAQPRCVRALCSADADARITDRRNNTPVTIVLKHQDDGTAVDYLAQLLAGQGNKGSGRGGTNIGLDKPDREGNTVFHLAASRGLVKAMLLLMQQPFCYDPNLKNTHNLTPMEIAIENKHPEIVELLKSYKP